MKEYLVIYHAKGESMDKFYNKDGQSQTTKSKKNIFIKEWVMPVVSAIILALLIGKFLIFNVYVPSGSMVPTINIDDRLLVVRNYTDLHSGQIVVFYSEEFSKTFIKRLIGLPGDHIEIKEGIVYRNGEKLEEDYVKNVDKSYTGTFDVPNDKYFFLGDNRPNSKDSRWWINPYIDKKFIKGVAWIRVYPFSDFGSLK